MRLLTLPLALARLPFRIAKAALAVADEILRPGSEAPVSVTRQPQPRFFRQPEPVVVAESAERGAEDGAGAEVHVDEPWPGYRGMTAAQIKARLRSAPPATAAAVSLFEAGAKGRSSVLEAASRRTRA